MLASRSELGIQPNRTTEWELNQWADQAFDSSIGREPLRLSQRRDANHRRGRLCARRVLKEDIRYRDRATLMDGSPLSLSLSETELVGPYLIWQTRPLRGRFGADPSGVAVHHSQSIAIIVAAYGIGYAIAARSPYLQWPITFVGQLGKVFGPLGLLVAVSIDELITVKVTQSVLNAS